MTQTNQNMKPYTSPAAVLGALSTLDAALKADMLGKALTLFSEGDQLAAVDKVANLLKALADEVSNSLHKRKEAAIEAGKFPEAARLAALERSVDEYSSAVTESHQVSFEYVMLAEDDSASECDSEQAVDDFTNI